jgi:Flp pilus assembly pilin Flp
MTEPISRSPGCGTVLVLPDRRAWRRLLTRCAINRFLADHWDLWGSTIAEALFLTIVGSSLTFKEESLMHTAPTNPDQAGQGLAEYALILSLIAIAAILSLLFMSGGIKALLSAVGAAL